MQVQSQLGGWLQANPWLATGSARVIVNEVNSSSPSQLRGSIEIAGRRAEFVLANPSGIQVGGAAFINASGVTLSTGAPVFNAAGGLDALRVQGGTVTVEGQGLDARNADYAAILARAVQLHAGVWARQLQVVTGANEVDAPSILTGGAPQVQPLAGSMSAPSFAIDVSQLGGMYAGKITLLATDAGVGVRNAGRVQATAGPLTLGHEGWLSNSGSLQASGNLQLGTAGTLGSSGSIRSSDGDLRVASGGMQRHDGTTSAMGTVALASQADVQAGASSVIAAGLRDDAVLVAGRDLRIQAGGEARLRGQTVAPGILQVDAASIDMSSGRIAADAAVIRASSGGIDASAARMDIAQGLTLQTPATLRTDRAEIQAQALDLQARGLSNRNGRIEHAGSGDLTLDLRGGALDNTGGRLVAASANLALRTGMLANTDGLIAHAGTGRFTIDASEVDNTRGRILTDGAASLTSTGEVVNHDGLVSAVGDLAIGSASLANTLGAATPQPRGIQSVQGQVSLIAGAMDNSSKVYAARDLTSTLGSLRNSGSLHVGGDQRLTVADAVVTSGHLGAHGHLAIQATSFAASGTSVTTAGLGSDGTLSGAGGLTIDARGLLQSAGKLLATGDVGLQAEAIDLAHSHAGSTGAASRGNVALVARRGDVRTEAARVLTPGRLAVTGQALSNEGGQLSAGELVLALRQIGNAQGQIQQTGTADLRVDLQGGTLDNTGGEFVSNAASLQLRAGTVMNVGGLIGHAGDAAFGLDAARVDNTRGRIIGNAAVAIDSMGEVVNHDGLVSAGGHLALRSADLANTASGTVEGSTGIQSQTGAVTLRAEAFHNSSRVSAIQDVRATFGSLANSGSLYAGGSQHLTVEGEVQNSGIVAAQRDVSITAASLRATASSVIAGGMAADGTLTGTGQLAVDTRGLLQSAGQLLAASDVALRGDSIDLRQGQVGSAGTGGTGAIELTARAGDITTAGARVSAPGALTVHAAKTLDNTGGQLVANADGFVVRAGSVTNVDGLIGQAGNGKLTVTATHGGVDNTRGRIIGNASLGLSAAGDLSNHDGLVSAIQGIAIRSKDLRNSASGNALAAIGIQSQRASVAIDAQAFHNSSSVYAGQGLAIDVGSLDNSGSLYAGGNQTLTTSGSVRSSGTVAAAGHTTIRAGSMAATGTSVTAAGMGTDGNLSGVGHLDIDTVGSFQGAGQVLATSDVSLRADAIDLSHGQLGSTASNGTGKLALTARAGDIRTVGAQISTPGQLTISAAQALDNRGGQLEAGQLQLQADRVDNRGGRISQAGQGEAPAAVEVAAAFDNSGGQLVAAGDNFRLDIGGALTNTGGLIGHVGAHRFALSAGKLDNSRGRIVGNGSVDLASAGLLVNQDGLVSARGDLAVSSADLVNTASGDATGPIGIQSQTGNATLNARDVTNGSSIYAAKDLTSTFESLDNSGSLYAGGSLSLTGGKAMQNSGTLAARQHVALRSASFSARAGSVTAAGMGAGGELLGGSRLAIDTAGHLQSAGQVLATGDMSLRAGSIANTRGQVIGHGAVDITSAGALTNHEGTVHAEKDLTVAAGSVHNAHGRLSAAGAARVTTPGVFDNTAGLLASAHDVGVKAGSIANAGGMLASTAGSVQLATTAGGLDNRGGRVQAAEQVSVELHGDGNALLNAGGRISAVRGHAVLSTGALDNAQGLVSAGGDMHIDTHGHGLSNRGSRGSDPQAPRGLIAGGMLRANAGHVDNQGGLVHADGIDLRAASVDNRALGTPTGLQSALIYSGQDARVLAEGEVRNAGSQLLARKDIELRADHLDNTRGLIRAGGDIALSAAQRITNAQTSATDQGIEGRNLRLESDHIDNLQGAVRAAQSLAIRSDGWLGNVDGLLSAAGSLRIGTR